MAKIDFNTVINGEYEVAVGNEYEVAPGKWGRLKPPTIQLQKRAYEMTEDPNCTDIDVCKEVLAGLPSFEEGEEVLGMPSQVVVDFFTLVLKIVGKLSPGSTLSEASATPKAES